MTKDRKILYAVAAIVIIILLFLLVRTFRKDKAPDSVNMELIKAKDETIKVLQQTTQQFVQIIKSKDRQDSLFAIQLQNNQPKYIINERSLQNVPVIYRDISKEQLRKRATDY